MLEIDDFVEFHNAGPRGKTMRGTVVAVLPDGVFRVRVKSGHYHLTTLPYARKIPLSRKKGMHPGASQD